MKVILSYGATDQEIADNKIPWAVKEGKEVVLNQYEDNDQAFEDVADWLTSARQHA
jgi:co-chaperonin GroES (HSP10)